MKKLIILVGLPAAGKSHFVKNEIPKLYEEESFYIASTDNMIEAWGIEHDMTYDEAWKVITSKSNDSDAPSMNKFEKEMFDQIKNSFDQGISVIVDRTNMSQKVRAKYLSIAPKDYRKIGVVFTVEEELHKTRLKNRAETTGKTIPGFVIATMQKSYQIPDLTEFDELLYRESK